MSYLSAGPDDILKLDLEGGQRVYNGAVDVGCGEYDWRNDYGKKLSKYAEVEIASTNVALRSEGVSVPAKETLKFRFRMLRTGGTCTFRVVGDAVVTATSAGVTETLEPTASGVYVLRDVPARTEGPVIEVVGGDGGAVVCDMVLPRSGVAVVVR